MGHNPSEKQLQEMFQETRPDPTWNNNKKKKEPSRTQD
jgi:hypothetical protein